jgi:hypothetical protein
VFIRRSALLTVVMLAAVACSQGRAAPVPDRERRLRTASQGLCDALFLASQGRVRDAATVFYAETHAYLHELAAELQETDPAAAAGLLEAKQRVERVLDSGADPVGAHELLTRLQRALGDAALAAGLPPPLCREGAS